MKIQIVKGKRVRDPGTKKVIPEDSILEVKESSYWIRLLKDGDVVEMKDEKPSSKK